MITVRRLTKTFGRFTAVNEVSFTLAAGEAAALWGPNGAGKTTIIRCVLGLLRYRGRIAVAGHDVRSDGKACRAAIGYVPQELALPDDFRVVEALRFFAALKGVRRGRARSVLGEIGLGSDGRKRIGELSGGMKQRLALGLALLADPPILLLDELTSNLDRSARGAFLAMLREERSKGRTVLFTSHRVDEVEQLADRVLVLEAGRLECECGPQELSNIVDLRCILSVHVAEEALEEALRTLQQHRYQATRNGRGLLVHVPATDKAGPIRTLIEAQITVRDFDVITDRIDTPEPRRRAP